MRNQYYNKKIIRSSQRSISLQLFLRVFGIGKASVCEDVAVVKEAFESMGDGISKPTPALPRVVWYPVIRARRNGPSLFEIQKQLLAPERRIQADYIYYSDILSHPGYLVI